jgi:hypothetical protein
MKLINYQDYLFELNLVNLTQHSNGNFNASCNVCNEDYKKHRLWFLKQTDGSIIVKCFNGDCELEKATSFYNYIKLVDPALASKFNEERREERFKETITYGKQRSKYNTEIKSFEIDKDNTKFFKKLSSKKYEPLTKHPKATEYCINRKIPKNIYNKFYYCVYNKSKYYDKLIMPIYRNKDNCIYGFVARSIKDKKFLVSLSSKKNIRLYNIFNIDDTMITYILESMIDAFFVDNSIAMLTSSIPRHILDILSKPVFVFDNDKTGVMKSIKYAKDGYKVVIFPKEFAYKDINEAIVDGWDKDRIKKMIIINTYYGIQATMKLKIKIKEMRLR